MAGAIMKAQWRTGCADNSLLRLIVQEKERQQLSVQPSGPKNEGLYVEENQLR